VAAFAGAAGLATGSLDLGREINARLPAHSPVLAGAALAAIVGVPHAVVAARAWRGDGRNLRSATIAGGLLGGWIAGQIVIIRELSPLQACYAGAAVVLVVWARRTYAR